MREIEDKLFPNYDSQLKNMSDTNLASFEKFEAQGGNFVENAYEVEKQLVEIERKHHAIVGQAKEKNNGIDLYETSKAQSMKIQGQDLMQKENPSNKVSEKSIIDKVINMICALFATIEVHGVMETTSYVMKFMGFFAKSTKINPSTSFPHHPIFKYTLLNFHNHHHHLFTLHSSNTKITKNTTFPIPKSFYIVIKPQILSPRPLRKIITKTASRLPSNQT
jgi:hypothetical protein